MNELLESPRARVVLFAVFVLLVLGSFAWSVMQSQESPTSATSAVNTSEPVATPTIDSPSAPAPTGSPRPEPTSESASATATPESSPSPKPEREPLPEWTQEEVITYLRTLKTVDWQESQESFIARLVAAGAVPESRAAQYSDEAARVCDSIYCYSEFLDAKEIQAGEGPEITASVKVRLTANGEATTQTLFCTLTLATGADAKKGLFVGADCLGPNG